MSVYQGDFLEKKLLLISDEISYAVVKLLRGVGGRVQESDMVWYYSGLEI